MNQFQLLKRKCKAEVVEEQSTNKLNLFEQNTFFCSFKLDIKQNDNIHFKSVEPEGLTIHYIYPEQKHLQQVLAKLRIFYRQLEGYAIAQVRYLIQIESVQGLNKQKIKGINVPTGPYYITQSWEQETANLENQLNEKGEKKLNQYQILSIMHDIIQIIAFLHQKGIGYTNLTSKNILVKRIKGLQTICIIKLTDLSKLIKYDKKRQEKLYQNINFMQIGIILYQMFTQEKLQIKQIEKQKDSIIQKVSKYQYKEIWLRILKTCLFKEYENISEMKKQVKKKYQLQTQHKIKNSKLSIIKSDQQRKQILQSQYATFKIVICQLMGLIAKIYKNGNQICQFAVSKKIVDKQKKYKKQKGISIIYQGQLYLSSKPQKCVIKQIPIFSESNLKNVIREIKGFNYLKNKKNKNIIELYDHFYISEIQPSKNAKANLMAQNLDSSYYFITKLHQGRTLQFYIKPLVETDKLAQQSILSIFYQIIDGLSLLHHYQIVYRDLKPQNIIISGPKNRQVVKMIDFGTINFIFKVNQQLTKGIGSSNYIAPQVLSNNDKQYCEYNEKCDSWSLGVLIYELLSNKTLLKPGISTDEIIKELQNLNQGDQLLQKANEAIKGKKYKQIWKYLLDKTLKYLPKNRDYVVQLKKELQKKLRNLPTWNQLSKSAFSQILDQFQTKNDQQQQQHQNKRPNQILKIDPAPIINYTSKKNDEQKQFYHEKPNCQLKPGFVGKPVKKKQQKRQYYQPEKPSSPKNIFPKDQQKQYYHEKPNHQLKPGFVGKPVKKKEQKQQYYQPEKPASPKNIFPKVEQVSMEEFIQTTPKSNLGNHGLQQKNLKLKGQVKIFCDQIKQRVIRFQNLYKENRNVMHQSVQRTKLCLLILEKICILLSKIIVNYDSNTFRQVVRECFSRENINCEDYMNIVLNLRRQLMMLSRSLEIPQSSYFGISQQKLHQLQQQIQAKIKITK